MTTAVAALVLSLTAAAIGPLTRGVALPVVEEIVQGLIPDAKPKLGTVFAMEFGSLVALVGLVTAWMLFSKRNSVPQALTSAVAPLSRLGRSCFYLDDTLRLFVTVPLRGLAELYRLLEWLILDGLLVRLPSRVPEFVARGTAPLRSGLLHFYALAFFLALAMFLAVVLWLQG